MRENDCNIERLVNTILGKPADRVPNFELLLDHRACVEFVGEPLNWPLPRKYYNTMLGMGPHDYVYLTKKLSMDALSLLHYWAVCEREDYELQADAATQKPTVHDWDDLGKMDNPPDINEMVGRIRAYKKAAEGTGIGVLVGTRAILCNTYTTLGLENCMIKLCEEPEFVRVVMDRYMDYAIKQTEAVIDEDIDIYLLDDNIAATLGLLVPPEFIEREWFPRVDKILEPVRKKGLPIMWHCCGNLTDAIPLALRLGIHALHPFQPSANNIYDLKEQYKGQITFMGNMDIAGVLAFGTPDEVIADTKEHIERLSVDGRYICGSSHSITDAVPPENFLAMIEACHS